MKILNRSEFINEIYNPTKEQKEYEELQRINEGILSNLFGKLKNLFKKDWETIKGDAGIIAAYKEMDDKLTGFSSMKLSKKDQCNQIRQELVDFAVMWYEKKMDSAKEDDRDPKLAKSMKFKNETLQEELDNRKKKIKEIAGNDNQMIKWANRLMDDMKSVINRVILNDIKDDEVKKEAAELEKKDKEEREIEQGGGGNPE